MVSGFWAACPGKAQESPANASPAASAGPSPTPAPPRTAETAVTPFDRNPKRHQQFLDRLKEGKLDLLFVGDSITDNWPRVGEWTWLKFAPFNPADFGVGGERTEDVLWRLTNGELEGISPKVVVLMIGTNNLRDRHERLSWTAAGVGKIVETIHAKLPQAKLLLLAVFPRGKKGDVLRTKVAAVNAEIAKLDDGGKTTRYLDIGHVFLDAEDEIPPEVMADGLHPTARGYELWYEAMKPTLDEMMK